MELGLTQSVHLDVLKKEEILAIVQQMPFYKLDFTILPLCFYITTALFKLLLAI